MMWILNHLCAPTLTHLHLTLFADRCEEDPFEPHTTVTPLLRALVQRTLLTYQLLVLSLSLKIGIDGGGPDHCNSLPLLPVLKPLLVLSELRGFTLHRGECAMFTTRDKDIAALAHAWAKWEMFEIDRTAMTCVVLDLPPLRVRARARDDANANADPGRPTVKCLNVFHEHCANLVRLAIPLALPGSISRTRMIDPGSDSGNVPPSDYVSSHLLKKPVGVSDWVWVVGRVFGKAEAKRHARHFLQLFPKLEVGREEDWGHGKQWRTVCSAMQRVVRVQLNV